MEKVLLLPSETLPSSDPGRRELTSYKSSEVETYKGITLRNVTDTTQTVLIVSFVINV